MKVNIAVCGKFHYHNYLKNLEQLGILNKFYYSHKISTDGVALGVSQDKLVNLWQKEYLLGLHLKLFNRRGWDTAYPLYSDLWQALALRQWSHADLWHFMLDGTANRLIERAKAEGAVVIGEPLNTHPLTMNALTNAEYATLQINKRAGLPRHKRRFLSQELAGCDHLVVASNFIKQSFVEHGTRPEKIHVIPYGVDLEKFYPLPPAESSGCEATFQVICVGQILPRKGQFYLLEAWKQLKLKNARLLLIGDISYEMKPVLRRYEGMFEHLSSVPNAELCHYYGRSSVFVLPSLEDGFGMVVGEALACGLPVITTTNTGASEIIEHGKEGFVVPAGSVEQLAHFLELLYRDGGLREEMSRAALKKARTELDWKIYAGKLYELYQSLSYLKVA